MSHTLGMHRKDLENPKHVLRAKEAKEVNHPLTNPNLEVVTLKMVHMIQVDEKLNMKQIFTWLILFILGILICIWTNNLMLV